MAEILPGVHQIEGLDPSAEFTTHVYLLKDPGDRWTLIDTGLPGSEVAIDAYLARHQIDPGSIRRILVTHLHRDHTGGLRRMIERTGARSYAHWIEAAFLAQDPPYDGPGVPPAEAVRVDEVFKDGEHLDIAGGLIAYHTPGHTPGHTVFYHPGRKLLFCGDLFFGQGNALALTPPEFTQHPLTAQISARRVAQLSVEAVLSYHGGPFLKGAAALLRPFAAAR